MVLSCVIKETSRSDGPPYIYIYMCIISVKIIKTHETSFRTLPCIDRSSSVVSLAYLGAFFETGPGPIGAFFVGKPAGMASPNRWLPIVTSYESNCFTQL